MRSEADVQLWSGVLILRWVPGQQAVGDAFGFAPDRIEPASVQAAAQWIQETYGTLDILVNCSTGSTS